ncbi:hypothetical protein GCK72_009043 [Caenorhabditis remanei]|uniref:Uncharacterized protein n=1 Tax=Caenorhabditis remanei TaxID=31234 RepID=A0A6A5H2G9_CAERE|nr:hypothetical protein GCK72_009043 [Caenorhabditis remanei]KAF1760793.1 hypothetical protein GCK72_009043 [Caenorhabditis remanei]
MLPKWAEPIIKAELPTHPYISAATLRRLGNFAHFLGLLLLGESTIAVLACPFLLIRIIWSTSSGLQLISSWFLEILLLKKSILIDEVLVDGGGGGSEIQRDFISEIHHFDTTNRPLGSRRRNTESSDTKFARRGDEILGEDGDFSVLFHHIEHRIAHFGEQFRLLYLDYCVLDLLGQHVSTTEFWKSES